MYLSIDLGELYIIYAVVRVLFIDFLKEIYKNRFYKTLQFYRSIIKNDQLNDEISVLAFEKLVALNELAVDLSRLTNSKKLHIQSICSAFS